MEPEHSGFWDVRAVPRAQLFLFPKASASEHVAKMILISGGFLAKTLQYIFKGCRAGAVIRHQC